MNPQTDKRRVSTVKLLKRRGWRVRERISKRTDLERPVDAQLQVELHLAHRLPLIPAGDVDRVGYERGLR